MRCLPYELFFKAYRKFMLVLNVAANLLTGVLITSQCNTDQLGFLHRKATSSYFGPNLPYPEPMNRSIWPHHSTPFISFS